MTGWMLLLIVVHVVAVVCKLSVFAVVPRLQSVGEVQRFLTVYRPYHRLADWTLWVTGAGLVCLTNWHLLLQTWMLISLTLYLLVFFLIRFAINKELERISASRKRLAADELRRLRTNSWCVGLVAIALLGIIAYLMMTKP